MKHALLNFHLEDITALRQALARGEAVKVKHLGVFLTRQIPARTYRVPKTQELITSKPAIKLKFRPTKAIIEFLQKK